MASTRELVSYILETDKDLRNWFKSEHGFTVNKVRDGNLENYQDLIGVIIRDGLNNNVITQAQADGTENL